MYYNPTLNINGAHLSFGDSTYISELLTDHTLDWLAQRDPDRPFFAYLSHKAVHALLKHMLKKYLPVLLFFIMFGGE